ncbi:hypothetical protein BDW02DRAFT_648717 [Decorospora gaudefroyi]|uniref:Uncharacterized protein n=1 Tax=Decorospora gaudefroyi TaxID=184978 RepID=A0A6A5KHS9_9PLEO|nr:hypothetical protein BDW02DRAFT_648717 [Decorospora gaudefroyi]
MTERNYPQPNTTKSQTTTAILTSTLPDTLSIHELHKRRHKFSTDQTLHSDLHARGLAIFDHSIGHEVPAALREGRPVVEVLRGALRGIGGLFVEMEMGRGNGVKEVDAQSDDHEEENANSRRGKYASKRKRGSGRRPRSTNSHLTTKMGTGTNRLLSSARQRRGKYTHGPAKHSSNNPSLAPSSPPLPDSGGNNDPDGNKATTSPSAHPASTKKVVHTHNIISPNRLPSQTAELHAPIFVPKKPPQASRKQCKPNQKPVYNKQLTPSQPPKQTSSQLSQNSLIVRLKYARQEVEATGNSGQTPKERRKRRTYAQRYKSKEFVDSDTDSDSEEEVGLGFGLDEEGGGEEEEGEEETDKEDSMTITVQRRWGAVTDIDIDTDQTETDTELFKDDNKRQASPAHQRRNALVPRMPTSSPQPPTSHHDSNVPFSDSAAAVPTPHILSSPPAASLTPTYTFPPLPALPPADLTHFHRGMTIALENVILDSQDEPDLSLLEIIDELDDTRPIVNDWEHRMIMRGGQWVYQVLRDVWHGMNMEEDDRGGMMGEDMVRALEVWVEGEAVRLGRM